MTPRMISYDDGDARFNYRVAGVCVEGDHVLLHQALGDDFWAMPGGRCHLLEASPDALRREMREELALDVGVVRLLWMVENFFEFAGRRHHELALYYQISLPSDCPLRAKDRAHAGVEEGGIELVFAWFPVASLGTVRLFPTFLREGLAELPAAPTHLVHHDGDS